MGFISIQVLWIFYVILQTSISSENVIFESQDFDNTASSSINRHPEAQINIQLNQEKAVNDENTDTITSNSDNDKKINQQFNGLVTPIFGFCNAPSGTPPLEEIEIAPEPVETHCSTELEAVIGSAQEAESIRERQNLEHSENVESITSNPLTSQSMQDLLCLKSEKWTELAHCICGCRSEWYQVPTLWWTIWNRAECPISKATSITNMNHNNNNKNKRKQGKRKRKSKNKNKNNNNNNENLNNSLDVSTKINLCLWLKHYHSNVQINWIQIEHKVVQMQTILHSNYDNHITSRDLKLILNLFHYVIHSIENSQNLLIKHKNEHNKWNLHNMVTKFENDIHQLNHDLAMNQQIRQQFQEHYHHYIHVTKKPTLAPSLITTQTNDDVHVDSDAPVPVPTVTNIFKKLTTNSNDPDTNIPSNTDVTDRNDLKKQLDINEEQIMNPHIQQQPEYPDTAGMHTPTTLTTFEIEKLNNHRRMLDEKLETEDSYKNALESIPRIQTGLKNAVNELKTIFKQSDNYLQYFSNVEGTTLPQFDNKIVTDTNNIDDLKDKTLNLIEHAASNLQQIHNKTMTMHIMSVNKYKHYQEIKKLEDEREREYNDMNHFNNLQNINNLDDAKNKLINLDKHCQMLLKEISQILTELEDYVNTILFSNTKIYHLLLHGSIYGKKQNNSNNNINNTINNNKPPQAPQTTSTINDNNNKQEEITDEYLKNIDVYGTFVNAWNKARKESINEKAIKQTDKDAATEATKQTIKDSKQSDNSKDNKEDKDVLTTTKTPQTTSETTTAVNTTGNDDVVNTTNENGMKELGSISNDKEKQTTTTETPDDSSNAKQDGIWNHPLFYVWSFAIISFITVISIFASFLVYKK